MYGIQIRWLFPLSTHNNDENWINYANKLWLFDWIGYESRIKIKCNMKMAWFIALICINLLNKLRMWNCLHWIVPNSRSNVISMNPSFDKRFSYNSYPSRARNRKWHLPHSTLTHAFILYRDTKWKRSIPQSKLTNWIPPSGKCVFCPKYQRHSNTHKLSTNFKYLYFSPEHRMLGIRCYCAQ